MHRISGSVSLPLKNKNVAYVAQTSWLRNATIRQNILFGEPYYPERYSKVVRACALGGFEKSGVWRFNRNRRKRHQP
ncbi:hypothetical protein BC829DRAFT_464260 [Chytridium lagenaria]|nr:hypothetical protein BC829DRAFT_464260 [Chytridium lagenaria]